MRRMRGDDGAYAVLYAITIVLFIAFAGIVVDISSARADRRINRLAADSAAIAGASELRSDSPNALQACTRATAYLNDNIRGLSLDPAAVCTPFAAYADNDWTCPANALAFTPVTSGDYQIVMTWPVVDSSSLLTKPNVRPGDVTQTGDSDFDGANPCERFAVSVSMERDFVFGPAVGGPGGTSTLVSSVGRAAPQGEAGDAAVALLLLERHGCEVLSLPNTGPTVIVQGNGKKPGGIHADSTGSGSDGTCSNGSKIFNVQQNDEARIVAAHAEQPESATGTPAQGIIGSVALTGASGAVPGNVYSGTPGFRVRAKSADASVPLTQQVPTPRPLVTRGVVDKRYRTAVKARIAEARNAWDAPPAGFDIIELTHPCKLDVGVAGGISTSSAVFVRCSGGPDNRTISADLFTFAGSNSTVIFDREVDVGSGKSLTITDPRKVFVNGSLKNQGSLLINSGSEGSCSLRAQNNPDKTGVLVLDGSLTSTSTGAIARLCSTAVILATCPVPDLHGEAPVTNTCTDTAEATGGQFDWSAPNAVSGPPTPANFQKLEDLALWGESSEDNRFGGGVSMVLSGVFFLPNANAFEIGGTGAFIVTNAQLIVRRLEVSGDSTFSFRPDPEDVVTIPFYGGVTLIR